MTFCARPRQSGEPEGFGFNTAGTISSQINCSANFRSGGLAVNPTFFEPRAGTIFTSITSDNNTGPEVKSGPTFWQQNDSGFQFSDYAVRVTLDGVTGGYTSITYTTNTPFASNPVPFDTGYVQYSDAVFYRQHTVTFNATTTTGTSIASGTLYLRHLPSGLEISRPWQLRWN